MPSMASPYINFYGGPIFGSSVRIELAIGSFFGAPDRNRTCGLQLRRLSLYPTELRGHVCPRLRPKASGATVHKYFQPENQVFYQSSAAQGFVSGQRKTGFYFRATTGIAGLRGAQGQSGVLKHHRGYRVIFVPRRARNCLSHSGWPGQAGVVTMFLSVTALLAAAFTPAKVPPACSISGATAG